MDPSGRWKAVAEPESPESWPQAWAPRSSELDERGPRSPLAEIRHGTNAPLRDPWSVPVAGRGRGLESRWPLPTSPASRLTLRWGAGVPLVSELTNIPSPPVASASPCDDTPVRRAAAALRGARGTVPWLDGHSRRTPASAPRVRWRCAPRVYAMAQTPPTPFTADRVGAASAQARRTTVRLCASSSVAMPSEETPSCELRNEYPRGCTYAPSCARTLTLARRTAWPQWPRRPVHSHGLEPGRGYNEFRRALYKQRIRECDTRSGMAQVVRGGPHDPEPVLRGLWVAPARARALIPAMKGGGAQS